MAISQKHLLVASLLFSSLIFGCAKNPDKISATYISPMLYQNLDCDQIREEVFRVSYRVDQISGVQRSERTKDTVATTVGVVVFWPALFFLMGDDNKEELGRLKGEYEALQMVAIQKKCSVADEIKQAKAEKEIEEEN